QGQRRLADCRDPEHAAGAAGAGGRTEAVILICLGAAADFVMAMRNMQLMRRALAPVAAAWLQEAAGFGVWHEDRAVAYWPESAAKDAPRQPDLASAHGDGPRLGLVGATGPRAQERLDADAALLAQLVRHEQEIEQLADELVARQDQLLA